MPNHRRSIRDPQLKLDPSIGGTPGCLAIVRNWLGRAITHSQHPRLIDPVRNQIVFDRISPFLRKL